MQVLLGTFLISIIALVVSCQPGYIDPTPTPHDPTARPPTTTPEPKRTAVVLLDDYQPRPPQGDRVWPYNRLGGDRGKIDPPKPNQGAVKWGSGEAKAEITKGNETWVGVWTAFSHPVSEGLPLDFSEIFPDPIDDQFQGKVTALRVSVRDGQGDFQVELQAPDRSFLWKGSASLNHSKQELEFSLPPLEEVRNLSWIVKGRTGDFVVIERVELVVELPQLEPADQAFLESFAMLLDNFDHASGLTRDRINFPSGDFDNVSASGMQAAAAAMAYHLGFVSQKAAIDIVESTTGGLLSLPKCGGLWPHFVRHGEIAPGTEWSSVDTIIALIALLEAREALGLDTTKVEEQLIQIEWAKLLSADNYLSHGYAFECDEPLDSTWRDFGTETWLANFGYATATGELASMNHVPPTFNGSGFIDELAWLLIPPPDLDIWGIDWASYRRQALKGQMEYYSKTYPEHCYASTGLFGLSAGEVPVLNLVDTAQIYQPFGVGGTIDANDGSNLLGHPVITPHYAGMVAALDSAAAVQLWEWMESIGISTPLNNVESFMLVSDGGCRQIVWNGLKGSWNLSLQTLGWGRLLSGKDNPLHDAVISNGLLSRGNSAVAGIP